MNGLKFIFCFFLLFSVTKPASADTWYEVKSENFVLYSDNRESYSLKLVEDLEYFRYFLQGLTNVKDTTATLPLEIFAYKNPDKFRKETGARENVGGFFYSHFRGTTAFLATPKYNNWTDGREILFHEYVHYFMDQFTQFPYPKWYAEGFADYLSAFTYQKGTITVGQVLQERVYFLETEKWLSLEEILESRIGWAFDTEKKNNFSMAYAQSWFVVHYFNSQPEYQKRLVDYLIKLSQGEDFRTAFEEVFGKSIKDMENEISLFWKRKRIPYQFYELSEVTFKPKVTIKKLSPGEAEFVKAKARAHRVLSSEDLGKFEKSILRAKKDFPEQFGLDLLLAEQLDFWGGEEGELKAAETVFKIAENHPNDPFALTLRGRTLFYKSFEAETLEERKELLAKARTDWKKVIENDPNNFYAQNLLGYSYIFQTEEDFAPGFKALIKAAELLPQQANNHFILGLLQTKYGFLNEAQETFEYYLQKGTWPQYRAVSAFCLDEIALSGEGHQCLFSDWREIRFFGETPDDGEDAS